MKLAALHPGIDAPQIHDARIFRLLSNTAVAPVSMARDAVNKARELKGLSSEDVAALLCCQDRDTIDDLFAAANEIKQAIYGKRLVLFAPLYISNLCSNDCLYCAFAARNKAIKRKALSQEEIAEQVRALIRSGQKRVLLVAGEAHHEKGLDYILRSIETVYKTREGHGEIRRLNVNIAPVDTNEFRLLKQSGIGTYQLFQETYHRATYARMHPSGPKADYDFRISALDRAFEAGIDDVGMGVLFGLFDFRYEVLALLEHIRHMEQRFGVGCHTISIPRLEPADGAKVAQEPPYPVSDLDFKKIVAVLRLAVPYTGLILSTRESEKIRCETIRLGISQISAGSRTAPGAYTSHPDENSSGSQFQLGDHRSLNEVIVDVAGSGHIPSFCTACYRLGRTGGDFMELAKPGLIKNFCLPNALLTFKEYLEDYADPATRELGQRALTENLLDIPSETRRNEVRKRLEQIEAGARDLFF